MTVIFRARSDLIQRVRHDLSRHHAFATERVGFLVCRAGRLNDRGLVILAADYDSVEDNDYLEDFTVGAMMGPAAIRKALQRAYNGSACNLSIFHIHMHDHYGMPGFSRVDLAESMKFVPDFFNAAPNMPHGAIILSKDRAVGLCWSIKKAKPVPLSRFSMIDAPLQLWSCR